MTTYSSSAVEITVCVFLFCSEIVLAVKLAMDILLFHCVQATPALFSTCCIRLFGLMQNTLRVA